MRIGIDISQTAYHSTGVAQFLIGLLPSLIEKSPEHTFVLFSSGLRNRPSTRLLDSLAKFKNVQIKQFPFSPKMLDILWNVLHILPIETFLGDLDIFISSDWSQPPVKRARSMTIIYDLVVYKVPEETAITIINTQKRKLAWVKKECQAIFCISKSTKRDAESILSIPSNKLHVIYPGLAL